MKTKQRAQLQMKTKQRTRLKMIIARTRPCSVTTKSIGTSGEHNRYKMPAYTGANKNMPM